MRAKKDDEDERIARALFETDVAKMKEETEKKEKREKMLHSIHEHRMAQVEFRINSA